MLIKIVVDENLAFLGIFGQLLTFDLHKLKCKV